MSSDPRADGDLDRKYRLALGVYLVLAALIWFTIGDGEILVGGRPVQIRWIPLLVVGGFAFKTVLARKADRIRRQNNGDGR